LGYVVGEDVATVGELKRHIRERLPEYMVPEAIQVLEAMPITANGKIDRKRLPAFVDARQSSNESFVAPRDVLELELVKIWESVLGVQPIGVKDNFFDLGGHSLLAASLMTRIQNVMGRELPLFTLFERGTIEHLAGILRREASLLSFSCLVELQASGSQPPLFFVHPSSGHVLCYLDLARRLGPDQPFYGLQTPGLHGEQPFYTNLEDMARHYVEALKRIQPAGPYFLGGWSLGGAVAYEMAQQLVEQSERVSQLLLLDAEAGLYRSGHIDERVDEHLDDDAVLLMDMLSNVLPISREDLEPYQVEERVDYLVKKAKSVNLFPPDIGVTQVRFFLEVFRTNVKAKRRYVPRVYPGTVTLFKTARQVKIPVANGSTPDRLITEVIPDPTLGWGALAAGGVRVIDVPGRHVTMLNDPHVETLALRIRDCLSGEEQDNLSP
jgi:thioesterase domain-containing protein